MSSIEMQSFTKTKRSNTKKPKGAPRRITIPQPVETWLREAFTVDHDGLIPKTAMYENYERFCHSIKLRPRPPNTFGKLLVLVHPHIKTRRMGPHSRQVAFYSGIAPVTDWQPPASLEAQQTLSAESSTSTTSCSASFDDATSSPFSSVPSSPVSSNPPSPLFHPLQQQTTTQPTFTPPAFTYPITPILPVVDTRPADQTTATEPMTLKASGACVGPADLSVSEMETEAWLALLTDSAEWPTSACLGLHQSHQTIEPLMLVHQHQVQPQQPLWDNTNSLHVSQEEWLGWLNFEAHPTNFEMMLDYIPV